MSNTRKKQGLNILFWPRIARIRQEAAAHTKTLQETWAQARKHFNHPVSENMPDLKEYDYVNLEYFQGKQCLFTAHDDFMEIHDVGKDFVPDCIAILNKRAPKGNTGQSTVHEKNRLMLLQYLRGGKYRGSLTTQAPQPDRESWVDSVRGYTRRYGTLQFGDGFSMRVTYIRYRMGARRESMCINVAESNKSVENIHYLNALVSKSTGKNLDLDASCFHQNAIQHYITPISSDDKTNMMSGCTENQHLLRCMTLMGTQAHAVHRITTQHEPHLSHSSMDMTWNNGNKTVRLNAFYVVEHPRIAHTNIKSKVRDSKIQREIGKYFEMQLRKETNGFPLKQTRSEIILPTSLRSVSARTNGVAATMSAKMDHYTPSGVAATMSAKMDYYTPSGVAATMSAKVDHYTPSGVAATMSAKVDHYTPSGVAATMSAKMDNIPKCAEEEDHEYYSGVAMNCKKLINDSGFHAIVKDFAHQRQW
jgi:hypothetical protein